MNPTGRRKTFATAIVACVVLGTAACSSGQSSDSASSGDAGKKDGKLTIAVLQKQGDQQYFVDEAQGAKDAASEAGDVEIKVIDLGTDANKAVSEVENVIAQGVDGIVIVVPDAKVGPQVIDAAKAANIPLVAADDAIESGDGKAAPFVGFDGKSMGESVGTKAGELYKAAGWSAADTRIISSWQQDLQTCNDRVGGALDAFTTAVGGDVPEVVKIGTDNSATEALDKAGAVLTDNQDVKNWVVWGCNDENETGVVTALQNGGVNPDNIIGVGLGAYLTCKDWKAGENTGNKAALYIGGPAVGGAAVKVLVDKIRNGVDLPANTIADTEIVDATTWEASGLSCT